MMRKYHNHTVQTSQRHRELGRAIEHEQTQDIRTTIKVKQPTRFNFQMIAKLDGRKGPRTVSYSICPK